jgi:PT repeat
LCFLYFFLLTFYCRNLLLLLQPSYADDQHKMCFNGLQSWLLGWYSDRHRTYDPLVNGNLVGTKMVALDDYLKGKTNSSHTVVLKIVTDASEADDYYVMYNRAKGVNAEVPRYANEVTIIKGRTGADSKLVGHLASPGQVLALQISGKSMVVKLCRFDTESSTGAEYALFHVYDSNSTSIPFCPTVAPTKAPTRAPTRAPTQAPTNAPTAQPSGIGIKIPVSGSP